MIVFSDRIWSLKNLSWSLLKTLKSNMEHVVIKTEDGLYDEFEMSEADLETSDNLFGKTPYRESFEDDDDCDDLPKSGQSQHRATWRTKDCQLLIALYKEEHPNLGKSYEVKTKRMLWTRIAAKMRKHGSSFSPLQVEAKWKNLKRAYVNAMINRKKGKSMKVCPYENVLSEMVLLHPSLASNHQTESAEGSDAVKEQFLTDSEEESSMVSVGCGSPAAVDDTFSESNEEPAQQTGRPTSIAEELQKWRREFAKERQEKRDYRKAKLEAYDRRTAVLEKQINYKRDLLLALVNAQNRK